MEEKQIPKPQETPASLKAKESVNQENSTPVPKTKPEMEKRRENLPIINKTNLREKALLHDEGAKFEIKENPAAKHSDHEKIELKKKASKIVQKHDDLILKYAKEEKLDPDLVRAIMFAENATGHKAGLNKIADKLNISNTPLPMNINKDKWAKLINKKTQ